MQTFTSSREAKEFLVGSIVAEAQREGVPLSEVERKMLYFSETAWTLPDITQVNEAFDREYDQDEYEQKIASLSRNFCADARKNNSNDLDAWNEAVQRLSSEDHYILVLIDAEGQPTTTVRLPFWIAIGALTAGVVLYLLTRR